MSLGPAAFIYFYMKMYSKRTWPTKVEYTYRPNISIVIPTYNEAQIIPLKLANVSRLIYPENLAEIILVDSNSSDKTVQITREFLVQHPQINLKILVEKERKGKSHALNYALEHCTGEVIIVSDADCYLPNNLLETALPFLADPAVGAVYVPKILLNSEETWVTRMEQEFLESANTLRLGESKAGSTAFFEGGFSAFKRVAFDKFDVYGTGSDDCGTVICVIEKSYRAMQVPEAQFYSSFPASYKGRISVKLRRANQLLRIFVKYLDLILRRKLKISKKTIVPYILLYLMSPVALVFFFVTSILLAFDYPILLAFLGFLAISKIRTYSYELLENNILILIAGSGILAGRSFSVWNQPEDRIWLTKEKLSHLNLI
jgi:cellulose synthase/poly-beta-1,6-N-acetylglucosamine synthase-like glycosyltransferase